MNTHHAPISQLLQKRHINIPDIKVVPRGQLLNCDILGISEFERPLLISDAHSLAAAQSYISEDLKSVSQLTYPMHAKPTMDNCVFATKRSTVQHQPDVLIFIGSGSLSDIGKYVAAQMKLPLIIIATAPSMNGYTSINASLVEGSLKQSFAAKMPDRIIISQDIIHHAPTHMVRAGRSDALASISADADWQLSSHVLGTPYYPEIFAAQAHLLHSLNDTMQLLELLILQGLGMSAAGSSAPASGGEHMLAHIVELAHPQLTENMLHGELIAHTHPLYFDHQQQILASQTPPALRKIPTKEEMQGYVGNCWETIRPHYEQKVQMLTQHQTLIQTQLSDHWPSIQARLIQHFEPYKKLVSQTTNKQINQYIEYVMPFAAFTRNRFTMLDLAH